VDSNRVLSRKIAPIEIRFEALYICAEMPIVISSEMKARRKSIAISSRAGKKNRENREKFVA
jgi:hypothetical protein